MTIRLKPEVVVITLTNLHHEVGHDHLISLAKERRMLQFSGRIALITGAGRGVGFAYAKLLAGRGAHVVLHDVGADTDGTGADTDVAENAAAVLRDMGRSATAANGSIESRDDCQRLIADVIAAHERLDIVVHNAGWVGYQSIEQLDEAFLGRMMALCVQAPLWLAQAAWPVMARQGYGRILLTTSDRGLYPEYAQPGLAAYAAAKMAVVGIMNVLTREGAEHGILVNAISPVAKTRMWGVEGDPEELHPESVAVGAAFLVSEACCDSGWILRASNGQFHAIKRREASGVDYPRDLRAVTAATPEEVSDQWQRIALDTREVRR